MSIIDLFVEQSRLILTGIIITIISGAVYRITPTGFVSGGKYRTKGEAIVIYLATALLLGLISPIIYLLSDIIIVNVPVISIIGILIFSTNFIINQSVPTWKHTSRKTILIYFLSIFLIIIGFLLKMYLFF